MKILVTGTPGSGKTSLVEYALRHGYDNYVDTYEVKGLCEWRDYKTGEVIDYVENVKLVGGEGWYKKNGWYWINSKIDELLVSIKDPIICGSADNVMDFYDRFDKIVLLYKSREDLVHNLLDPNRKQDNGKDPKHYDRLLKWQETLLVSLKSSRPVIIYDNDIRVVFDKVQHIIDP